MQLYLNFEKIEEKELCNFCIFRDFFGFDKFFGNLENLALNVKSFLEFLS